MAGTLALMTAWAAPEPDASIDADQQRALIARKIVSNLFFLSHHPDVGAGLRHVIGNVHQRWLPMAQGARPVAPQADAALHASETEAALLH